MSYALVSGLGADAPIASAATSALSLVPTKSELRTEITPYIDIANAVSPPPGFDPTKPETWTPERIIPYGMRMAQEIQKQLGIAPVDLAQIEKLVKGDLKWLDEMGIPLTTIPTNLRQLCVTFAKTVAIAACKQLGIPPEIGTATLDALSDGEFTSSDVESIGGVAGGMGGTFVCGLIGLPPQLGGYLGSYAGKIVGGLVSDVLDIGGGKAEREERRRQRDQARAAVRKELNSIRGQYQSMVVPLVRTLYWETFDNMLEDLENFWEKTECTTGVEGVLPPVRFPLLWGASGLGQGLDARAMPFLRYQYDGSRCPPQNYSLERPAGQCVSFTKPVAPGLATGCPSMFGCPYPVLPPLGAGGAERVAQAFAAYNVWWLQPGNRAANTDAWKNALPQPSAHTVDAIAHRSAQRQKCESATCRQHADRDIAAYVAGYNQQLSDACELAGPNSVLAIGMAIQSDIVATGGAYAAAAQIRLQKNALRAGRLDRVRALWDQIGDPSAVKWAQRKVSASKAYGITMNAALNYGLPAVGAVMIAGALLKRRR